MKINIIFEIPYPNNSIGCDVPLNFLYPVD